MRNRAIFFARYTGDLSTREIVEKKRGLVADGCNKYRLNLCSPNEDFGKRNIGSGVSFRGSLRGCEYWIWATNARKITRKDTPDLLFRFPKSSFGEHNHNPSNGRFQKVRVPLHTFILEMFGGHSSVLDGLWLTIIRPTGVAQK